MFTLKLYAEKNELLNLESCGFALEWRRKCKVAKLDRLDIDPDPVGLDGATNILGGCIVLSECLLPGKLPWTWSKFKSGLDDPDPVDRRTTSSTEIDVRRVSNRRQGGRWG